MHFRFPHSADTRLGQICLPQPEPVRTRIPRLFDRIGRMYQGQDRDSAVQSPSDANEVEAPQTKDDPRLDIGPRQVAQDAFQSDTIQKLHVQEHAKRARC